MSAISGYVLTILGVVLMFIVIELILPNGKTVKYIRSILGMVLIFVIVLPIAKLKNLDLNNIINNQYSYELNYDYLYSVHLKQTEELKNNLNKLLKDKGIINAEIIITIEKQSAEFIINQIYVDLSQAVISQNDEHIINYTTLKTEISEYANTDLNKVVIDE